MEFHFGIGIAGGRRLMARQMGESSTGETKGYAQSGADTTNQNNAYGTLNSNLSQFNGGGSNSPIYKSLLNQGTSSTNQAYDAATRNNKLSSAMAGVSAPSGAAQGGTAAMGASRATALGQVGNNATEQATNYGLAADQMLGAEGAQYGNQADSMFGTANNAEQSNLQRGDLWSSILSAASGIGGAALGLSKPSGGGPNPFGQGFDAGLGWG